MSNKKLISGIISVALFFLIQTPASAGVYKWVDESGQVHYGERPGNTDAERVTIRQNETTKPRTIKKAEEETAESDKENTDQQAEVPAEPVEEKISKKEKRKLCNEAKSDLAAIASRGRMREVNAKGEYIYLTEQQRQQRISAAQKKKRKFCR